MAERISNLAQQLRPYWLRDVAAGTVTGSTSGLTVHDLSGAYHTGTLLESQAPWAATKSQITSLAGAGLTYDGVALNVGAGNGLTVNADDVALTTPGTLTAATSNSATGNHTHAVTTGAASTLTVSTSNATGSSASLARADHLHTITSSADVTAGGTALLASSSGNLKLATGNIGSTLGYNGTFTSGFAGAGWRVDYGVTEAAKASATFDNLTIRGRMRVYELLIQQIRATNGSVFVSSSSKVFTVNASTDPTWTVNGATLQFNSVDATLTTTIYTITTSDATEAGADRTHYHGFLVGDIIRAQQMIWDGADFAGVIQSDLEVTTVTNLYEYTAARATVTDAAAVGYDYVRLGNVTDTTRQGTVYLTSDDDNAPFIDIVDGIASHADWNTAGKIRARLGRLDGITDAEWGTLDGYGLWSDNVYLTGSIYATDGIFSGTVYAGAGSIDGFLTIGSSGGIYQGTGTSGSPTNGLKIYQSSSIGQIAIYDGGLKTMRITDDDLRMYLATYDGDYNDYRTIKWLPNIDGSDTGRADFDYRSDITSWSTASDVYLSLSTRVNAGSYTTRDASVILAANNWNGSALNQTSIYIVQQDSGTSYNSYIGLFSKYLYVTRNSAPSGTPSAGYCFVWVDSSTNTLKMKDSGGTTRSVTFS